MCFKTQNPLSEVPDLTCESLCYYVLSGRKVSRIVWGDSYMGYFSAVDLPCVICGFAVNFTVCITDYTIFRGIYRGHM